MTTTLFLVRHAVHDLVGRVLCGRMPGVSLGDAGRRQSDRLAERMAREDVAVLYTSPLERARETAAPIAQRIGIEAKVTDAISEVEYGEWSGVRFAELDRDPRWALWNRAKTTYRPPGGETLLDVQSRAVRHVEGVAMSYPERGAVLVSHGDVIKAVLAYYLGMAIDGIGRFEISPASVSTVVLGDWGAKVLSLNEVVTA